MWDTNDAGMGLSRTGLLGMAASADAAGLAVLPLFVMGRSSGENFKPILKDFCTVDFFFVCICYLTENVRAAFEGLCSSWEEDGADPEQGWLAKAANRRGR